MERTGLALGGGGTRGSYQLGVWKYLREKEIHPVAVTGTSIGAANGALVVQGDYHLAEELWMNLSPSYLLEMDQENRRVLEEGTGPGEAPDLPALLKQALAAGGLNMDPLRQVLVKYVDEDRVRAAGIQLGIVTVDITSRKPVVAFLEDIPRGQLFDYILASCALPIFRPQEIDGHKFIDGAFFDVVPVKSLAGRGLDRIIAVDLSGTGMRQGLRVPGTPVITIRHSAPLGNTLQLDPVQARNNAALGYLDAARTFGEYLGNRYFLMPDSPRDLLPPLTREETAHFQGIVSLPGSKIWNGRVTLTNLRKVLEKGSGPEMQEYFGRQEALLVSAAEITAEELGLDRYRPWTLAELLEAILEKALDLWKEHPPSRNNNLLGAVTSKVKAGELDPGNLNPLLPEIITWGQDLERHGIFNLLALSLPRYCLTAFFLILLTRRGILVLPE